MVIQIISNYTAQYLGDYHDPEFHETSTSSVQLS